MRRHVRRVHWCILPSLLLTVPVRSTRAQESIPRDLVLALVGTGSSTETLEILVGRAPAEFAPMLYVPAGGRILGSLVRSRFGPEVVIAAPGSADSVRAQYERILRERGWSPPATRDEMGYGIIVQERRPRVSTLCDADKRQLTLDVRPSSPSNSTVVLTMVSGPGTTCSADPRERTMMRDSRLAMPRLVAPPPTGDESPADCYRGVSGTSSGGTARMVTTAMSPQQLLGTFATQLTDQGWHPVTGSEIAVGLWTKRDSSAAENFATISVTRDSVTSRCVYVRLDISRRTP